jgi:CRP/FNR family transcriptional regulator
MLDLSSIASAGILEGLSRSQLEKLGAIAFEQPTLQGERLFKRGEQAETFYIVKEGRYALTITLRALGADGEIAVEEKALGEAFGWSALVEPHDSIYSGYCTQDGVVVAIPRSAMLELLDADEGLGRRFTANLTQLIGARARVLQDLWIEEVQRSMPRVRHWAEMDLSTRWLSAIQAPHHHGPGRRSARPDH